MIGVQHAARQPYRSEDQADFTSRDHAKPHEQAVRTYPTNAQCRYELACDRDHAHCCGETDHRWFGHRAEIGIDANTEKEDRYEDVADRTEVGCDALVLFGSAQCEAGHERADDEGELGGFGQ